MEISPGQFWLSPALFYLSYLSIKHNNYVRVSIFYFSEKDYHHLSQLCCHSHYLWLLFKNYLYPRRKDPSDRVCTTELFYGEIFSVRRCWKPGYSLFPGLFAYNIYRCFG